MSFKILIVDDDQIVLFLHDLSIKQSGFSADPLSFKNGQIAIDYLNSHNNEGEQYLIFFRYQYAGYEWLGIS